MTTDSKAVKRGYRRYRKSGGPLSLKAWVRDGLGEGPRMRESFIRWSGRKGIDS